MWRKYKGFYVFVMGLVFNMLESAYFGRGTVIGFNHKAMSWGEFICDYIALAIIVLGAFMMSMKVAYIYRKKEVLVIPESEMKEIMNEVIGCDGDCEHCSKHKEGENSESADREPVVANSGDEGNKSE